MCQRKCGVDYGELASSRLCMVECRSAVELARTQKSSSSSSIVGEQQLEGGDQASHGSVSAAGDGATVDQHRSRRRRRQVTVDDGTAAAATDDDVRQLTGDDKRSVRGAFVRIGRRLQRQYDPSSDAGKRRSGFVRIGRRRATETFLRIGRHPMTSHEDDTDDDVIEEKRAPAAFVRIGRAGSSSSRQPPSNFVRIGRKTAFVRIGRDPATGSAGPDDVQLETDNVYRAADDGTRNGEEEELEKDGQETPEGTAAASGDDELARQLRKQTFVRIGK